MEAVSEITSSIPLYSALFEETASHFYCHIILFNPIMLLNECKADVYPCTVSVDPNILPDDALSSTSGTFTSFHSLIQWATSAE